MKELEEMTNQGANPLSISQLTAQLPGLSKKTLDQIAADVRQSPRRFIENVGQEDALAFLRALQQEFSKRQDEESFLPLQEVLDEGLKVKLPNRRQRRMMRAQARHKK